MSSKNNDVEADTIAATFAASAAQVGTVRDAARPAAGRVAVVPDAATRYRCTSCGNLTRFDVTSARRTRAYHHFTVGGELTVEDEQVLDEAIESVECRWCGPASTVEALTAEEAAAAEG